MNRTATSPIVHADLVRFADERVNLPPDDARAYRDQVNRLRDRLAEHIRANVGFALVKMLHSGSVAKGTALRAINDLDVAVYVEKEKAPVADRELVPWLAARLREAYPDLKPDQFDESQAHCVTVSFRGSGLDVDVVPVLYEGDKDDKGYLVDKHTGDRRLTSIPLHLEFIRKRKKSNDHFAQIVRFAKSWAAQQKERDDTFRCKSFLLELLVANLVDESVDFSDYPGALEGFFSQIVKTGLETRLAFSDYYQADALPRAPAGPVEVFDPVNPENNVAAGYTLADRHRLVSAAEEAADAISEALYATTKSRAIDCWQRVFGTTFRGQ